MSRLFRGCALIFPSVLVSTVILASVFNSVECSSRVTEEAYVVDTRYPVVISENALVQFTQFGMSVALASGPDGEFDSRPSGWIFIGAPTSNSSDPTYKSINTPGVVWRCSLGRKRATDTCEILNIDPSSTGRTKLGSPAREDEGSSWIGGNIEVKHGRLVACGHRWTRGDYTFMNGICYWLSKIGSKSAKGFDNESFEIKNQSRTFYNRLFPFFSKGEGAVKDQLFYIEDNGVKSTDTAHEWALGQAGFSLHIVQNITGGLEVLLGAPGVRLWSGAIVRYIDNPSKSTGPNFRLNRDPTDATLSEFVVGYRGTKDRLNDNHWFDYFGYSVSSGKYLNNETISYAGGAPRGNDLAGEVIIFDIPKAHNISLPEELYKRNIKSLCVLKPPEGSLGSYFGSVLYSLDIDGDGQDELFVGAPMYTLQQSSAVDQPFSMLRDEEGNYQPKQKWFGDQGSVFVYSFGRNKSTSDLMVTQMQILNGSLAPAARFSSAISSLKLDRLYIVIGAPYENDGRGAIYIYKAEKKFDSFVQRISGGDISKSLLGFGCSISLAVDVDDNGTPDLAIGAYKSKQVVVLRTRSVVRLKGEVNVPGFEKIPRNATEVRLKVCVEVIREFGNVQPKLAVWSQIILDTRLTFRSFINRNPGSYSKMSNYVIVYQTNISTSASCEEIVANIENPNLFKDAETDPEPLRIVQEIWYNETSTPGQHLVEYQATSGIKTNVVQQNTPQTSKTDFKAFESNKPYGAVQSTPRIYLVEISPNDCKGEVCEPSLTVTAEWFHKKDEIRQNPITEYSIGGLQRLVLRVNVSNAGETAIKPRFNIEWHRRGVSVSKEEANLWLLSPSSCTPFPSDHGHVYNCNFSKNLGRDKTESREFVLDMSDIFATELKEDFNVTISVYPLGHKDDPGVYRTRDFSLTLIANSKVIVSGSKENDKLRNSFDYEQIQFQSETRISGIGESKKLKLYSSWRQTYKTYIESTSSVETIQLSFKLPWGLKTGGTTAPKPLLLVYHNVTATKGNVHCDIPESNGVYYLPDPSQSTDSTASLSGFADTVPAEVGGERSLPSVKGEPPIVERRRREAISIDYVNQRIIKKPKFEIEEDMVYIHCNDEASEYVCIQIQCKATNVKAGSSVEVAFEFFMVKDSIDQLMENGKEQVLVESIGKGIIFPKSKKNDLMDTDVAHTRVFKMHGTVPSWIYVVATLCGILQLTLIVFILYKCGFFKRETKKQLKTLKEAVRRSTMLPNLCDENVSDNDGNLVDNIAVEHQQIDPTSLNEEQSVVEKL